MITATFKTLVIAFLLFVPRIAQAQTQLTNGTMGREFWIAIPPNEKVNHPTTTLEIYVTSKVDTKVTLEMPGLGIIITKQLKAFKTTTFGQADGIGSGYEIRESEVNVPYGIHISSPDPIAVNVLNAKATSSDGYTALPVSVWGKENIHCSFYDFGEIKPWGGGFIVVASQNNTVVTMLLRGKGFGRTVGGKKIGDIIQRTLQKGDVYMVRGDGATIGSYDLTGSRITSNKPVGLISFHERTMIPAVANNNGRDHISEMIPPTSAWGKKFVSYEFKRKDKGDFYRAVAKEDGTIVKCSWYDKATNSKIQSLQWILKAGQFEEYLNSSSSPGGESIRGYAVWESNKPILLMQYAYSAQWDGSSDFDPMMIVVPPIEQYLSRAVFQTPASSKFITNQLNLFAVGDSTDLNQKLLKSIKLDGKTLFESDPKILLQRVAGTNIYYLTKNLMYGTHEIESDTKIGGYMYGFSDFDQYGWPAAIALNKIDELDTLAPELGIVQECGLFKITATENRNGNIDDNLSQRESGISDVMLLKELSTNFKDNPFPASFENDPIVTRHEFNLEVVDLTKDARAVFEVIDRAGNVVRDTVDYIAAKISLNMPEVDFGKVRVGTTKEFTVVVKNTGTQSISLMNLRINNPDIFFVTNLQQQQQLAPGAGITVTLRYSPKMESTEQFHDRDSLIITTGCTRFAYAMSGRGVMPKIAVGDFNAGLVKIGEKVCLENGLWVTNPGTDDVTITEISGFDTPFSFSNSPQLPFTIAPGDTLFLKDVCFQAGTTGNFVQNIIFKSDAMAGDSISEWRGSTTTTGTGDETENNHLLKVSPNPVVNGEIQIEYSVATRGSVILEIFEPTGKSVKVLLKENLDPGNFTKSFSSAEFQHDGIYYCRLTVNGKVIATREIVIMK